MTKRLRFVVNMAKERGLRRDIPSCDGTFEPLIDCEEDRVLRAVLVGMLREAERGR